MKVIEFIEIINRITYKPNYSFNIRDNGDFLYFSTNHRVPDIFNPEKVIKIHNPNIIEYSRIENLKEIDVVNFVKNAIIELEMHELDEWFCLDKQQLSNPHIKKI